MLSTILARVQYIFKFVHIINWFTSLSTPARYSRPDLNIGFENFNSSPLSGSASFPCTALTSPQKTEQYYPQIEY